MSARRKPAQPPSKAVPAILCALIAIVGFITLMVRLEATREGYRISALRAENTKLEDENRYLWMTDSQLSSHERLRSLAAKFNLVPPTRGQIVMMP